MPGPRDKNRPRSAGAWLRSAVAIALVVALANVVDVARILATLRGIDPSVFVLLLAVNTAIYAVFALRWCYFCRRLGLPHSFAGRLRGIYLFQVTSQVVPSPLLGEAGRFLAFPSGTRKRDVLKSIALDRVSNQMALALTVLLLVPHYVAVGYPRWFILLLCLPALVLGSALGWSRSASRTIGEGTWLARLRFLGLLADERFGIVPLSIGVTLALLLGLEFQLASSALPLSVEPSAHVFLLVPALSLVLSLLPISFGDWGTREFVALLALAPAGLSNEDVVAISVLVGVTNLCCSLPGALLWLGRQRGAENDSRK